MSVWLYIKDGPHIKPAKNGGLQAFGMHLYESSFVMCDIRLPHRGKIDPELERVTWQVSFREFIYKGNHTREEGEYRYRSAHAVLMSTYGGTNSLPGYSLAITGDNIHDVSELYSQILAGTIVPEVPYNIPQVTPLRNFGELLREMWRLIRHKMSDTCYRITYDEPK